MKINKTYLSIFLIWLVHISGLLGLLFYDFIFFVSFTPINLFLTSLLLMVNQIKLHKRELFCIILIFWTGIFVEFLGVNYGLLFGEYTYGKNLGPKLFGVPFLIGMNWVILTTISGSISNYISKGRKIPSIILGSLLMLFIDFFIEPVAPNLDFWEFKDSIVPLSNYSGWLITGLLTQSFYQLLFKHKELNFSINLYLALFVFFLFLGLKL
ncbi:MAG: carotenoid biosynthesis protein [Flavobacteriaceae bacterium]